MKILLIIATTVSTVLMADLRTLSDSWKTPQKLQECIVQAPGINCLEGDDEDPEPLLSGAIKDNTSFHNPIYRACVELKTTSGVLIATIGSNMNGHYYFNKPASGTYNLVVSAQGFITQVIPVTIAATPQVVNVYLK